MIDFAIDESSSTGTVTLSGDITIQHAVTLKETLLEGISKTSSLVLNLEQVERVDLATIQVLCAAHRAITKKEKNLVVAGSVPANVRETIKEAGYADCMGEQDTSRLWIEEN